MNQNKNLEGKRNVTGGALISAINSLTSLIFKS